jgi:cell fate (sporulation/competence/biofilm development) regulator YmcA (YheA/YmcA/DUF963 family)
MMSERESTAGNEGSVPGTPGLDGSAERLSRPAASRSEMTEPTDEELLATVGDGILGFFDEQKQAGLAALKVLKARLEAAELTIEQREIGYREQIERAEAAETEWDLWRQDYNAQVDRAEAAEREVEEWKLVNQRNLEKLDSRGAALQKAEREVERLREELKSQPYVDDYLTARAEVERLLEIVQKDSRRHVNDCTCADCRYIAALAEEK